MVAGLRRTVRPGGLILIGEAFLAEATAPSPQWGSYSDRRTTERALTAGGDVIEATAIQTPSMQAFYETGLPLVQRRAEALARTRPEVAAAIGRYVEFAWLNGPPVTDAIWMLRKTGD